MNSSSKKNIDIKSFVARLEKETETLHQLTRILRQYKATLSQLSDETIETLKTSYDIDLKSILATEQVLNELFSNKEENNVKEPIQKSALLSSKQNEKVK